jgi:hypothetical protein
MAIAGLRAIQKLFCVPVHHSGCRKLAGAVDRRPLDRAFTRWVGLSLDAILDLSFRAGLPLHVLGRVAATMLQRFDVVDDVASAGAAKGARSRARMTQSERADLGGVAGNSATRVAGRSLSDSLRGAHGSRIGTAMCPRRSKRRRARAQVFRIGKEGGLSRALPLINAARLPRLLAVGVMVLSRPSARVGSRVRAFGRRTDGEHANLLLWPVGQPAR